MIASGKRLQFAFENGPFMVALPMEVMIFHSYLSLPEGSQVGEDNTNRLGTLPGWHS